MLDSGNPFFVISETNQPFCSVGVENTDLLSVGREYRLDVCLIGLRIQICCKYITKVIIIKVEKHIFIKFVIRIIIAILLC